MSRLGVDLDGVLAQNADPPGEWWKPENWTDLAPVEGAIEGLTELVGDGHKIHVITARSPHENTSEWLNRHGFPFHSLHHTRSKWNIPCHIYVDDGAQFLNGFYERGLTAIKFRYPHNVEAFARYEADSWSDVVRIIRSGVRGPLRRNPRKLHRVCQ